MPWKETCHVHERMLFVVRLEKGERMTDLCREFGISRKTGYKILARYTEQSVVGLYDVKSAPAHIPHRTSAEVVDRVVALRTKHPTWGPRKLRVWLLEHEKIRCPAASTIGELLKKRGLLQPRRRRRRVDASIDALSTPTQANDLWCIDFKGQFKMSNGNYCYPLTVTDAHSRFLLVCEGMDRIDGELVWVQLEQAFRRYGVPLAIRSDNGSPFASRGLCGISKLSARWLALGVKHERIEPGHPGRTVVTSACTARSRRKQRVQRRSRCWRNRNGSTGSERSTTSSGRTKHSSRLRQRGTTSPQRAPMSPSDRLTRCMTKFVSSGRAVTSTSEVDRRRAPTSFSVRPLLGSTSAFASSTIAAGSSPTRGLILACAT